MGVYHPLFAMDLAMDAGIDEPEHVLCRRWRVEVMELTREQLSALTGFSASMIKDYERPGKAIDEKARRRYRMACAALSAGVEFDWSRTSFQITRPVRVTSD